MLFEVSAEMDAIDRRRERVRELFGKIEEALESEKENCWTPYFKKLVRLFRDCIELDRDVLRLYTMLREGRLSTFDLRDVAEDIVKLENECERFIF